MSLWEQNTHILATVSPGLDKHLSTEGTLNNSSLTGQLTTLHKLESLKIWSHTNFYAYQVIEF